MADEINKQEPEEPKKKAGLSLPVIIGIGAGVLIILVVVILFAVKMMLTSVVGTQPVDIQTTEQQHKPVEDKDISDVEYYKRMVDEDKISDNDSKYMETGRITTNPRASTQFVVVNLGLSYRTGLGVDDAAKKAAETDDQKRRFEALIRNAINNQIGDMTVGELQQIRRDSLTSIFKEKLVPVFINNRIFLRDVILVEYIIQ
jgi:flagellar basal body-associated protein FliL